MTLDETLATLKTDEEITFQIKNEAVEIQVRKCGGDPAECLEDYLEATRCVDLQCVQNPVRNLSPIAHEIERMLQEIRRAFSSTDPGTDED